MSYNDYIQLGVGIIAVAAFILTLFNIKQQTKIMAKQDQMDAMLARLDEATNEIADDMKKLRDELAAGNVSDASLEALDSAIAKLESMGKEDGEPELEA